MKKSRKVTIVAIFLVISFIVVSFSTKFNLNDFISMLSNNGYLASDDIDPMAYGKKKYVPYSVNTVKPSEKGLTNSFAIESCSEIMTYGVENIGGTNYYLISSSSKIYIKESDVRDQLPSKCTENGGSVKKTTNQAAELEIENFIKIPAVSGDKNKNKLLFSNKANRISFDVKIKNNLTNNELDRLKVKILDSNNNDVTNKFYIRKSDMDDNDVSKVDIQMIDSSNLSDIEDEIAFYNAYVEQENLKYVNNNIEVTDGDGVTVGSKVTIGGENFTVVDTNNSNVYMIADYNLNVGNKYWVEQETIPPAEEGGEVTYRDIIKFEPIADATTKQSSSVTSILQDNTGTGFNKYDETEIDSILGQYKDILASLSKLDSSDIRVTISNLSNICPDISNCDLEALNYETNTGSFWVDSNGKKVLKIDGSTAEIVDAFEYDGESYSGIRPLIRIPKRYVDKTVSFNENFLKENINIQSVVPEYKEGMYTIKVFSDDEVTSRFDIKTATFDLSGKFYDFEFDKTNEEKKMATGVDTLDIPLIVEPENLDVNKFQVEFKDVNGKKINKIKYKFVKEDNKYKLVLDRIKYEDGLSEMTPAGNYTANVSFYDSAYSTARGRIEKSINFTVESEAETHLDVVNISVGKYNTRYVRENYKIDITQEKNGIIYFIEYDELNNSTEKNMPVNEFLNTYGNINYSSMYFDEKLDGLAAIKFTDNLIVTKYDKANNQIKYITSNKIDEKTLKRDSAIITKKIGDTYYYGNNVVDPNYYYNFDFSKYGTYKDGTEDVLTLKLGDNEYFYKYVKNGNNITYYVLENNVSKSYNESDFRSLYGDYIDDVEDAIMLSENPTATTLYVKIKLMGYKDLLGEKFDCSFDNSDASCSANGEEIKKTYSVLQSGNAEDNNRIRYYYNEADAKLTVNRTLINSGERFLTLLDGGKITITASYAYKDASGNDTWMEPELVRAINYRLKLKNSKEEKYINQINDLISINVGEPNVDNKTVQIEIDFRNTSLNYVGQYILEALYPISSKAHLLKQGEYTFTVTDPGSTNYDYFVSSSLDMHYSDMDDALAGNVDENGEMEAGDILPPANKKYEYYIDVRKFVSNIEVGKIDLSKIDADIYNCQVDSTGKYIKSTDVFIKVISHDNNEVKFQLLENGSFGEQITLSTTEFKKQFENVYNDITANKTIHVKAFNGDNVTYSTESDPTEKTLAVENFKSLNNDEKYLDEYIKIITMYVFDENTNQIKDYYRTTRKEEVTNSVNGEICKKVNDLFFIKKNYRIEKINGKVVESNTRKAITIVPKTYVLPQKYYVYVSNGGTGINYIHNNDTNLSKKEFPELWNRNIHELAIEYGEEQYIIEDLNQEYIINKTNEDNEIVEEDIGNLYTNIPGKNVSNYKLKYIYEMGNNSDNFTVNIKRCYKENGETKCETAKHTVDGQDVDVFNVQKNLKATDSVCKFYDNNTCNEDHDNYYSSYPPITSNGTTQEENTEINDSKITMDYDVSNITLQSTGDTIPKGQYNVSLTYKNGSLPEASSNYSFEVYKDYYELELKKKDDIIDDMHSNFESKIVYEGKTKYINDLENIKFLVSYSEDNVKYDTDLSVVFGGAINNTENNTIIRHGKIKNGGIELFDIEYVIDAGDAVEKNFTITIKNIKNKAMVGYYAFEAYYKKDLVYDGFNEDITYENDAAVSIVNYEVKTPLYEIEYKDIYGSVTTEQDDLLYKMDYEVIGKHIDDLNKVSFRLFKNDYTDNYTQEVRDNVLTISRANTREMVIDENKHFIIHFDINDYSKIDLYTDYKLCVYYTKDGTEEMISEDIIDFHKIFNAWEFNPEVVTNIGDLTLNNKIYKFIQPGDEVHIKPKVSKIGDVDDKYHYDYSLTRYNYKIIRNTNLSCLMLKTCSINEYNSDISGTDDINRPRDTFDIFSTEDNLTKNNITSLQNIDAGDYILLVYYNDNDYNSYNFSIRNTYAQVNIRNFKTYTTSNITGEVNGLFANRFGYIEADLDIYGVDPNDINKYIIEKYTSANYYSYFDWSIVEVASHEYKLKLKYNATGGKVLPVSKYTLMLSYVSDDEIVSKEETFEVHSTFFDFKVDDVVYNPPVAVPNYVNGGSINLSVISDGLLTSNIAVNSSIVAQIANSIVITDKSKNVIGPENYDVEYDMNNMDYSKFNIIIKYKNGGFVPGEYKVNMYYAVSSGNDTYEKNVSQVIEFNDYERRVTFGDLTIESNTKDGLIHVNTGGKIQIKYEYDHQIDPSLLTVLVLDNNNQNKIDHFEIIKSSDHLELVLKQGGSLLDFGEYSINVTYTDSNTGYISFDTRNITLYSSYKDIIIKDMVASRSNITADEDGQYYTFDLDRISLTDEEVANIKYRIYDKYDNIVATNLETIDNQFGFEKVTDTKYKINILAFKARVAEYNVVLCLKSTDNVISESNRLPFTIDSTKYNIKLQNNSIIASKPDYDDGNNGIYDYIGANASYKYTNDYPDKNSDLYSIKVFKNGIVIKEIKNLGIYTTNDIYNVDFDLLGIEDGELEVGICLNGLAYDYLTIDVLEYIKVTSVEIFINGKTAHDNETVFIGNNYNLEVRLLPTNHTNNGKFRIEDENIASLNNNILSGIDVGETTLRFILPEYPMDINLDVTNRITSDIFIIDYDENTIDVLSSQTGIKNLSYNYFTSHLTGLVEGFTITNLSGNVLGTRDNVSTASVLKNGNIEYNIIYRGDCNGDGKITAVDYQRIKNYILGNRSVTNKYLLKAEDANSDGSIRATDYMRIKNIILKGSNS